MEIKLSTTREIIKVLLIINSIVFLAIFIGIGALMTHVYGAEIELPVKGDDNFISNHCYEKLSNNEIILNNKGLSNTLFADYPFDFCGFMAQKFVDSGAGWKISEINTIDGQYKQFVLVR